MPTILLYIVHGYIFLSIYYWISFKDNSNFNNMIIKSIATSYIIKLIFDYFSKDYFGNNLTKYTILLILIRLYYRQNCNK